MGSVVSEDAGRRFLAARPHPPRGRPVRPSLEALRVVLARLKSPERSAPSVHVTGTNGKTSTARAVAGLLGGAGRRVGLYTSPHLHRLGERVELDGVPIEEAALEGALAAVAGASGDLELSFFEAMTAAAFVAFAEAGVEVAVVEVGILGRHDATNVVASEVAVVTNVGHDHLDYAGPEPGAVAREKAGIVKATTRAVVLGEDTVELSSAIEAELARTGSPARPATVGRELAVVAGEASGTGRRFALCRPGAPPLEVSLARRVDAVNGLVALVAAEASLGGRLDDATARGALEGLRLPGRAEVRSRRPLVLLDVAHNIEAAAELRASIDAELAQAGLGPGPVAFVVGMTGARDPLAFLARLVVAGDRVVACAPEGPPGAVAPAAVAAAASSLGALAEVVVDPASAWAAGQRLLVDKAAVALVGTGSFAVVAAAPC